MNIKNHFLYDDNDKQVSYKATPNRGGIIKPEYVIEHYTADSSPQQTISWFLTADSKVSAHLLIDREGNITQFAPFNIKCWHAGKSAYKSVTGFNSHAIGIELTNMGRSAVPKPGYIKLTHKNEHAPAYWQEYTPKQIDAAKKVTALLVKYYNLKDVLGHDDISPGRKSDPGPAFPMSEFKPNSIDILHTSTNLNLRNGAGTTFTIVSVLPKDTAVEVLELGNGWSKVITVNSKLTGWVSNNYLKP